MINLTVPKKIQLINDTLCVAWADESEDFFESEFLRVFSPSAQNMGEKDIFGNQYGGKGPKNFPGVTIIAWEYVGNYAIKIKFSDGHNTGIYSWDYLKNLTIKDQPNA